MSGLVRAEPLFRARRRAHERRTARSMLLAASATTLVGGATWVALYSPVLRTTGVGVEGISRLPAAQVLAVARVPLGGSLLTLPTAQVRDRVASLAPVASVAVQRQWPHRVVIHVVERVPVAVVAGPAGPILVDRGGMAFAAGGALPSGVLDLRVAAPVVGTVSDAARSALAVWAQLPPRVRGDVLWVAAGSPDDVSFGLPGGATVRWGSAERGDDKLAALAALMRQHARVYDVSTPDVPVTG